MQQYRGQLGLVLIPDEPTRCKTMGLASQYRSGNLIDLEGKHTPHITLYHSQLKAVSAFAVDQFLKGLAAMLPISLSFTTIATFGGKFLFWNIVRSSNLLKAHEYAMELSEYFIPEGDQQTEKEKLVLSSGEILNMKRFGYPLVRKFWHPHITLGYYPEGISQSLMQKRFKGGVAGVAFIRVGEFGTLAEVINQFYPD